MPSTGAKDPMRADYASTRQQADGAWVAAVEPGSPADDAGIEVGMRIDAVNGVAMRDIIDWRWEADGQVAELDVHVLGTTGPTVPRSSARWGRTGASSSPTCSSMACTPRERLPVLLHVDAAEDARASLTLRDDDYRLSFLQGNFVTLTNVSDDERSGSSAVGWSP